MNSSLIWCCSSPMIIDVSKMLFMEFHQTISFVLSTRGLLWHKRNSIWKSDDEKKMVYLQERKTVGFNFFSFIPNHPEYSTFSVNSTLSSRICNQFIWSTKLYLMSNIDFSIVFFFVYSISNMFYNVAFFQLLLEFLHSTNIITLSFSGAWLKIHDVQRTNRGIRRLSTKMRMIRRDQSGTASIN